MRYVLLATWYIWVPILLVMLDLFQKVYQAVNR